MTDRKSGGETELKDPTSQLFMLSKKERLLVKSVLPWGLNSKAGRKFIAEKLGPDYIEIGAKLLKDIGWESDISTTPP